MGVGQPDTVHHEPEVGHDSKHFLQMIEIITSHVLCGSRRWRPGQPDSWTGHNLGPGDEDCAHLHSDGQLNDLHCLTQLRYICQSDRQRS